MYRPSPSASSAPSYGDSFMPHAAAFAAALPTVPPHAGGYLDGNGGVFPPFAAAAASSPPSSYSSSFPSSYYNIHRSISSHSLPLHLQLPDPLTGNALFSSSSPSPHQLAPLLPLSSSPSSSSGDLFELTSCPVRRVFSTGDLQGMNGSSPPRPAPSSESCGQEGGGAFSQKVGRYSAEERKERIERYRVKRHQRNFNKKITYACRKTLADSRPRVKGRFARNGETETDGDEREASDNGYEYCSYSDTTHKNSTNGAAFGGGGGGGDNGDWWWRVPGAAAAADGRQLGFDDDEELWATLGDMVSVNLAS